MSVKPAGAPPHHFNKTPKHPSITLSLLLPISRGAQVRKAEAIHLSSSMPPPVDLSSHPNQRLLKCISHMSKDDYVPMQPAAALGANQWNSIPREGGSPLLATESFQTVCPDHPVVAATLSYPAIQAGNA